MQCQRLAQSNKAHRYGDFHGGVPILLGKGLILEVWFNLIEFGEINGNISNFQCSPVGIYF